ncbi:MAG TPA: HD domain-containing protein [Sphingobium sp.]|nr:HD domain-containing protein [Sphingobium sp.]
MRNKDPRHFAAAGDAGGQAGIVPRPVAFTRIRDGSPEEFATVMASLRTLTGNLPNRILEALRESADEGVGGYQVNRIEHMLQSATRAQRAGESMDYVVAALVHDIGDIVAPYTHGEIAAAIIKPFVEPRLTWILKVHPVFTMYYYADFIGADKNAREKHRGNQWFDDAVYFVENYDENCFDPAYESLPLEYFEPMVHEVFSRPPRFD